MIRGMSRAIVALSIGALTIACNVSSAAVYKGLAGPVVFTDDFESGLTDGKGWIISGNAPTISSDMVRDGKYAMKTFLDRKNSPKSFRTEVSQSAFAKGVEPNTDVWYGFSVGLPKSYVKDNLWEIVAQWHGVPDTSVGEQNYIQNPPLSLQTANGVWTISSIWDSKRLTTKDTYEGKKGYNLGAYETGRFTDFVFHIKWVPNTNGILQVWKDGKQVVNYHGPIGFNDAQAPYFKMGLYKGWTDRVTPAGIVGTRTLYHDAVKVAVGPSARYEDVAPGGKPATSGDANAAKPQPPSGVQIRTE